MKIRNLRHSDIEKPEELRGITHNTITTTQLPPLNNLIPKSSTQIYREGMTIVAYPSMRAIKTYKTETALLKDLDGWRKQLEAVRLDLKRPYGTCLRCALPLPKDKETHVCP